MKIVIDAGHGYKTPGKSSPDGLKEYEFNRNVAEYLGNMLADYETDLIFAHSDSYDVPLDERTNRANSLGAALYISIHANAAGHGDWHQASGIETYIHTSKPTEAFLLATKIQENLISLTGLGDRGIKTADFHVLRETKMTAVLVECGFMTNVNDIKFLKSEHYRKQCAQAIAKAIISYYSLRRRIHTPSKGNINSIPLYKVQIGAFSDKQNAINLASKLKHLGFEAIIVSDNQ